MTNLFQDLRYGLRGLLRQPGFSIIAICSLALGIGANTAIFSVVNGVLLKPLPYPQPEQLVTIHQSKPNFEAGAIPYPNFRDLKARNTTFSAMAISRQFGFSLIGAGEAERVRARLITSEYFSVLELKPLLGRTLMPGEDESGAAPVAMISEALWRRKFGAAPEILKQGITLDEKSYSIIGVIPSSFNLVRNVDVYVPIGQWPSPALKSRSAALGIHGIGRLKPGVTLEQGQADLNRIMQELAITYPQTNRGQGSKLIALREGVVGNIQPILWLLLGAVGFVLLIACVNVSNLLLARSSARMREYAIRSALGAGRRRLVFQSLTESTLLALLGGSLGLLVAAWGTRGALGALPTALPRAEEVTLDGRVLIFTFVISLLTGLLAGLLPAFKTSSSRFSDSLKEGGRGTSAGRVKAQGVFVAVEIALALVLLIGSGLMIRSLSALWHVDPGFQTDNLMIFNLNLSPSLGDATPETLRATLRDLSDKLRAAPGVRAISFTAFAFPLLGEDDLFFWVDGQPKPASQSEMSMALVYRVEPDYLKVMDIPLKQGRFFTNQDDKRATPVAVIDETFAQQHFPNQSPIGKRIHVDDTEAPSQIVGVVGHVKQWSLDNTDTDNLQAQLYLPFRGLPDNQVGPSAAVAVRGDGPGDISTGLLSTLAKVVEQHNGQNVISNPRTMQQVIADSLADRRFSMILLGSFAVVALLLASLGIYGVISYLVGQRTHELGIRIALGAQRRDVVQLVLNHGMKMILAGVIVGLAGAFALTRLLTKMLFGVSATDPITFGGIAVLLVTIALLACTVPAVKATRVDPLVALREE
jgi:predicted permease